MPQLDIATYLPQITWLVITFSVLLVIMTKAVVPRIAGVLEARSRRIADNLDKAERIKLEAQTALQAYETALAEARAQAQGVIAEAHRDLAKVAARRGAELADVLGQRIREGEARIAKAKDEAVANLHTAAGEVAAAVCERLTGRPADPAKVGAAVAAAVKAKG